MGFAFQKQRPINHTGDRAARTRTIACLSVAPWNPYLRLLYGHLAAHGFAIAEDPRFSLRWLWQARPSVGFLHFHWPESLYRYGRGPARLRPLLSRAKLILFAARLAAARLLGYRIVWSIHQLFPHESVDRRLERRGARLLARASDLLIAHDHWTAAQARSEFPNRRREVAVVPHGSYIGAYPEGRPRSEVRSELGLPLTSFVFLCFGELREYKEVELLLAAFSSVSLPDARLVVAGNAKIPSVGSAVCAASAKDPRVVSMPTARELTRNGKAGWLFRPHDPSSLRIALKSAGADPADTHARARCALEIAEELNWTEITRDLAIRLSSIVG
jgi:beta-1,4-mannosyltransferase